MMRLPNGWPAKAPASSEKRLLKDLFHKTLGISDMATRTLRDHLAVSTAAYFFGVHLMNHHHPATVTIAAISTSFSRRLLRMTGIPVPPPITVIFWFSHERFTVSFLRSLSRCPSLTGQVLDKSCAKRLAKATLRCCPPVHPMAMVKTDLPSFGNLANRLN